MTDRHWQPIALALLCLAFALGAAARATFDAPTPAPPPPHDLGLTDSFAAPALWPSGDAVSVLWRPAILGDGLALSDLAGERAHTALAYPGVTPLEWRAVAGSGETLHVAWRAADGRLQTALLDAAGMTLRGPIEIGLAPPEGFALIAQPDGSAALLWIDPLTYTLSATPIDAAGRAYPTPITVAEGVQSLAAAAADDGTIWLATLQRPGRSSLPLAIYHVAPRASDDLAPLHRLAPDVPPGHTITTLVLALDRRFGTLWWGATPPDAPDRETPGTLTFPLDDPAAAQTIPLTDLGGSAATRSATAAAGQRDSAWIATAIQTANGWQPVIAQFRDGALQNVKRVPTSYPAIGRLALTIDEADRWIVGWPALAGAEARLFATANDPARLPASEMTPRGVLLVRGLALFSLSLVWIALPAALLALFPVAAWSVPAATLLYFAAKLLWPAALYRTPPPALAGTALDSLAAPTAVFAGAGLSALAALLAWYAARRLGGSLRQCWAAFAAVDVLLTWALFGAAVFPGS